MSSNLVPRFYRKNRKLTECGGLFLCQSKACEAAIGSKSFGNYGNLLGKVRYTKATTFMVSISERKVLTPDDWQKK
jgi:hypothetical protein